jgi:hypothetical protein
LGTVYSIFTQGGTAGPPHHLSVSVDHITSGPCGEKWRKITYRIVDYSNRKAGGVPLIEIFPGAAHNTCNSDDPHPTTCTTNYSGREVSAFTDEMDTGCPNAGGDCGITVGNQFVWEDKWAWCKMPVQDLARMSIETKYNVIKVNGNPNEMEVTTMLYP